MKNLTSIAGWLLLAAVLAVPSIFFYNWWSKNKEKAALERAQKVNFGNVFPALEKTPSTAAREMAGGGIGTAGRGKGIGREQQVERTQGKGKEQVSYSAFTSISTFPLTPPAAVGGNVATAAGGASETAGRGIGTAGIGKGIGREQQVERTQGKGKEQVSYSALTSTFPMPLPAVPGQSSVSTAVAVSTQTMLISYFKPKYDRDPTISPIEYRQKKEEENQRAEAERRQLAELKKRNRETGIESKLLLQGIVGKSVIINGDGYNVGQTVLGARILKVGSDYFIGEYKGKQFKKVLR